ncbi:MAG TPA: glycosyltransferase [Thermoanaerobaculia bacterium]|nr:glycosyltransferase [Thermoanaerobaculia bacterium]
MGVLTPGRDPRVLIFVVAYEAEATLAEVLSRIPPSVWDLGAEVLVIDDSSRDRTFEVGLLSADSLGHRVTVLQNPTNLGYGGNQKLGYAYAQKHAFDFVVLLHGDGQYAPESIPDLLAPLLDGTADAVLGSRMMVPGAARRGGMPLYKLVGNRILTWLQNRLLGTRLSEFHSGFRAYRVATLGKVPFEYNADVFHFDTEIIIQLLLADSKIVEVPIPTYYGSEICRVDGLKYAKDVLLATVGSRLHGLNLLHDRKFDVDATNRRYQLKLGYSSSHSMALREVPEGSTVLDIGSGPGEFAREVLKKGCVVDGADQFPPVEPSPFRSFTLWREPEKLGLDLRDYDYVLLLDIVEHLKEPERFLDDLRQASRSLEGRPRFIVTTGNVVFCMVRLQAVLGNFNYGRRGILDLTHTRLFTFGSLRTLFDQCGFRIERIEGVPAPFPLALGMNRASRALVRLNAWAIRLSRGFFAYQIFLVASPRPTVDALLEDTVACSTRLAKLVRAPGVGTPAIAQESDSA